MNPSIARALSLAIAVAVWTAISHLANLPLQLWPVIVGLACFLASGGGLPGLTKSLVSTTSGVVWAALYVSISGALGRQEIVDALLLGAAAFGMAYQARVPVLSSTAGAFAGAAAALGVMGVRAVTLQGSIKVLLALLIGVGVGYGAEYLARMVKTRNT